MIDLRVEETLYSSELLKFRIPADDPKADLIAEDIDLQLEGRKFYVSTIDTIRDGSAVWLDVEAEAGWYRLGDVKRVGGFTLTAVTRIAGLTSILDGTGWTVGVRTTNTGGTSALYSMEQQDATVLGLVREWAKITNTYPVFDTVLQTVDLVASVGIDRGIGFRYGRNLTRITRKAQPPLCTRLWPYGRQGLDIAGVNPTGKPYLADFSYYTAQGMSEAAASARYVRDEVWSDSSFITDVDLYDAAVARLAERAQPRISYTMSVLDLSELTGLDELDVAVGDTVRVTDSVLGFDVRTYVTRLVRYPQEPWRNQIELSVTAPSPSAGSTSTSREKSGVTWEMFKSDNAIPALLRLGGTWMTNRISLAFAGPSEAVYGHTVTFVGVGTGTLGVTAYDAESGRLCHPVQSIPYVDGQRLTNTITWAEEDQNGQFDYRIRMRAVPTGSPTASASGVNIDAPGTRFWILARGAVQRTPEAQNTRRFDYNGTVTNGTNGSVQQWTVPDNVQSVTITAVAAAGGGNGTSDELGKGGSVTATFDVTPGEVLDIYCGGQPQSLGPGGWPNGGDGATGLTSGWGGGGATWVVRSGGSLAAALIVAGAGGGLNRLGASRNTGTGLVKAGDGGFFQGGTGKGRTGTDGQGGGGAGQYGPGAAAVDSPGGSIGDNPSQGYGADGYTGEGSFNFGAGGGGAGWHGGGCAGPSLLLGGGFYAGDGGGGSGWVDPTLGSDISYSDGANASHGYVILDWNEGITL